MIIHPGVSELVMNTMDRCGFQIPWKGENLIATGTILTIKVIIRLVAEN